MSKIKLKKNWPYDAIITVAAFPDDSWSSRMPGIQTAHCRDCTQEVISTPYQRQYAEQHSKQNGKPVDFLCIPCAMTYAEHETSNCNDTCWLCHAEKAGYVSKAA